MIENDRFAGGPLQNVAVVWPIASMVGSGGASQLRIDNGKLKTRENPVREKSFTFALRVVKLAKFLESEKKEFVLSRQVLRSGTAIGALIHEAEHAESKADFVHKMSIALKEANETLYWLELLHQSDYIDTQSYESIDADNQELVKLLASIVKTSKLSKLSG